MSQLDNVHGVRAPFAVIVREEGGDKSAVTAALNYVSAAMRLRKAGMTVRGKPLVVIELHCVARGVPLLAAGVSAVLRGGMVAEAVGDQGIVISLRNAATTRTGARQWHKGARTLDG